MQEGSFGGQVEFGERIAGGKVRIKAVGNREEAELQTLVKESVRQGAVIWTGAR